MNDTETLTRQEHLSVLANLLKVVIVRVKNLDTELAAYKTMFAAFKKALPHYGPQLDEMLDAARQSPALREKLKQVYDIPLERFLALSAQSQTEEEMWKLFPKNSTDLIQ